MGDPPEPYKDWNAWALAQFDNDPRRAGLAARAAAEAQSIGAGIDTAIRAAQSAAGVPPPRWAPTDGVNEVASPPDVAPPAHPSDFHPDIATGGAPATPVFPAAAPAATPEPEADWAGPSSSAEPPEATASPTTGDGAPDRGNTPAKQDIEVSAQADPLALEPPRVSPDGRFYWTGNEWIPFSSSVPEALPSALVRTLSKPKAAAILAISAGALLGIGALLPWMRVTAPFVGSITRNGMAGGDGEFLVGASLITIAFGCARLLFALRPRWLTVITLIAAGVTFLVSAVDYADIQGRISQLPAAGLGDVGEGLYVCFVSGFVMLAAAFVSVREGRAQTPLRNG